MDTIQGKIAITRNHIISQLESEIEYYQRKMQELPCDSEKKDERWGYSVCHTIISRKRKLISQLSR